MSTKFIFVLFIFSFNFHLSFCPFFGSNNLQPYNLVSLVNANECLLFFFSLSLSFNVSLFFEGMCAVDFSAGARAVVSIILHLIRVYFPLHPVITCSIIRMKNKQWLISLIHRYSKLNVSHNDKHTCIENIKKRNYFFEWEKKKIAKFQVSQFIRIVAQFS